MKISISKAKELLLQGEVVVVPTETVYGLGALASSLEGIEKVYTIKGRSKKNPLIVHIADTSQLEAFVEETPEGFSLLASHFWPGPITLLLKAKEGVSSVITAGLSTVAIRMPNHSATLELIQEVGPIVAPSANLSGKPSSTLAIHVEEDFGSLFPVLEGEAPRVGLESTIIGYIDGSWKILRHGAISKEAIELVLKKEIEESDLSICPGKMMKHYSPATPLFIGEELEKGIVIVGYENRKYPKRKAFYSFGKDSDPDEIAKNLFATLRKLDTDAVGSAWIDTDLPESGLYVTIRERLLRAANKEGL